MKRQLLVIIVIVSFGEMHSMEKGKDIQAWCCEVLKEDLNANNEKREILKVALKQSIEKKENVLCMNGQELIAICQYQERKVIFPCMNDISMEFAEVSAILEENCSKNQSKNPTSRRCVTQ